MTKALSDDWMMDHGFIDHDIIQPKNYSTTWWASKKVYEMGTIQAPLTITSNVRCRDAIALLKREGYDMVPVLSNDGTVIGVVTEGNITKCILSGRCHPETPIHDSGVIYKTFHKFTMHSTLHELAQALDHDPFVLIVTEQRCFTGTSDTVPKQRKPRSTSVENDALVISSSPTTTTTTNNDHVVATPAAAADTTVTTSSLNDKERSAHVVTRSVVSGIVSRIDLLDYISHGGGGVSGVSNTEK
jgi:CBS domain